MPLGSSNQLFSQYFVRFSLSFSYCQARTGKSFWSLVRGQILCDWPFSCSHSLALQSLDTFSLHRSPYHPSTCDVWKILLDSFKSNSVKINCADEANTNHNLNENTNNMVDIYLARLICWIEAGSSNGLLPPDQKQPVLVFAKSRKVLFGKLISCLTRIFSQQCEKMLSAFGEHFSIQNRV